MTKHNPKFYYWDPAKNMMDNEAVQWADAVINLAGENVMAKRWNKKQKEIIVSSRVQSAKTLLKYIINNPKSKVKKILQGSGIGWYGEGNHYFSESNPAANDFLGNTCQQWEAVMKPAQEHKIKVSWIRIGIVLARQGGFFQKFYSLMKYSPVVPIMGNGNQIISWIHVLDLSNLFVHILENNLKGIFNAVSPNPITFKEFVKNLISTAVLPKIKITLSPKILKMMIGESSIEILKSCVVSSKKIQTHRFKYKYLYIKQSIQNLTQSN